MEMIFGFFRVCQQEVIILFILTFPWLFPALGQAEALPDFEGDVKTVLAKYCYGCHGAEKQKGKLRLDTMSTDLLGDPRSAERWHEVRAVINLREMPPDDEPKLSDEERTEFLDDLGLGNLTLRLGALGGLLVWRTRDGGSGGCT